MPTELEPINGQDLTDCDGNIKVKDGNEEYVITKSVLLSVLGEFHYARERVSSAIVLSQPVHWSDIKASPSDEESHKMAVESGMVVDK